MLHSSVTSRPLARDAPPVAADALSGAPALSRGCVLGETLRWKLVGLGMVCSEGSSMLSRPVAVDACM
jgi:hypothetical protein